jgi:hypothetical protein
MTQTLFLQAPSLDGFASGAGHLSHTEIFQSVEDFYRRFYFHAPEIATIISELVRNPDVMMRRRRQGLEFFPFLRERRELAH